MTRPTVVILCEHGEAKPHPVVTRTERGPSAMFVFREECPGGRVLNQAIIIERDAIGVWPKWARDAVSDQEYGNYYSTTRLDALASAQENQP